MNIIHVCEDICSQKSIDLKTVSKANAMLLRQLKFSPAGADASSMIMPCHDLTAATAFVALEMLSPMMLSSSAQSAALQCPVCPVSPSEINPVHFHQNYQVWSRKRTWVHSSAVPKIALWTLTQSRWCMCKFQLCWCYAVWTALLSV